MEITTIVGIVIALIIIVMGVKILIRKNADGAPSLESELHVDPESLQPVIPRHVRDQLNSPAAEEIIAPVEAKAVVEATDAAADSDDKTTFTTVKKAAEFKLNSNVEKAEISEFSGESSVLDVHLHEQQLVDEESALATAEEFITINIYPDRRLLTGDKTLKILMKYGLRYGEMSCFHRYSEDNSKLLFSVLQIGNEGPAGFDLEALSTEEVKGLSFFLALPHSDVQNAFDTMVSISGLIAREIEGVVYDQNNQEFTPQLREYWRHQAIDYRTGQSHT